MCARGEGHISARTLPCTGNLQSSQGRLLAVTRLDILIGSDGDSGGGGGPNLPTRRLYIAALDAWDGLTLDYTPTWPLHLLLTPQVDFQERRRLCAFASP